MDADHSRSKKDFQGPVAGAAAVAVVVAVAASIIDIAASVVVIVVATDELRWTIGYVRYLYLVLIVDTVDDVASRSTGVPRCGRLSGFSQFLPLSLRVIFTPWRFSSTIVPLKLWLNNTPGVSALIPLPASVLHFFSVVFLASPPLRRRTASSAKIFANSVTELDESLSK